MHQPDLRRLSDLRASQYWDKEHLVSRLLGERDRSSVVWDYVAIYPPGAVWEQTPPVPVYSKVPVVRALEGTKDEIERIFKYEAGASTSACRFVSVLGKIVSLQIEK